MIIMFFGNGVFFPIGSKLYYYGSPIISSSISGSGKVKGLGAK